MFIRALVFNCHLEFVNDNKNHVLNNIQLVTADGYDTVTKLKLYIESFWNMVDLLANVLFYVGFALEHFDSTRMIGHTILAFDAYIWILRLLPIFYNFEVTGPYVFMIQTMVKLLLAFIYPRA